MVGGAPIYGSDAIAGTVNVILKRNYQGLSFAGQSGVSERGRGGTYTSLSGLVGQNFDEERGNITLSMQYDKQNGIPTSEIFYQSGDARSSRVRNRGKPFQQQLYYGGQRYAVFTTPACRWCNDGTDPVRSAVLRDHRCTGSRTLLRGDGSLTPFNNGEITGQSLIQAGGDGFRIRDFGNFQVDSSRFSGTALFHYDFSDSLRFSGEAWYGAASRPTFVVNPSTTPPCSATGRDQRQSGHQHGQPVPECGGRATIISNLAANGQPTDKFYLARANTDLATGEFRTATDLYRVVGGWTATCISAIAR